MTSVAWTLLALTLGAAAPQPVAPVSGGNALTLPAQRHVVRVVTPDGRAIWLLALQQGSAGSRGLVLLRSDDEATSWRELAHVQPDAAHADRADLVVVGQDVALVYAYEGPSLSGSSAHDVFFQWWRYRPATHDFAPEPAVRVFDSTSSTSAFSRAMLAVDGTGRPWVQAFRLESDGGSTAVLAVSEDGGATFVPQPDLGRTRRRGGGRLLHLGDKLLFLWGMHDGYEPARFRVRLDAEPVGTWGPTQDAFSEGIYHGAALSAVADGAGGMHLVYKDETERLYYRHFDGVGFGARSLVESQSNWALQPAVTRVGGTLFVFYNQPGDGDLHPLVVRRLEGGTLSSVTTLDTSAQWKGYLAAVDALPAAWGDVPCLYGRTPTANDPGAVYQAWAEHTGTGEPLPDAGTPDAGTPAPDAGAPAPDAGTPPPPPETVLFSDDFERTSGELGPQWQETLGLWYARSRGISDLTGTNVATELAAACADCRAEVDVITFGVPYAGLFLRAPLGSAGDRYEAVVVSSGRVQVRKVRAGRVTVLGEAASGLSSLSSVFRLVLSVRGQGPVQLTASINGVVRLSTEDTADVLAGAGRAGLVTGSAGVPFDRFRLVSEGTAPAPDAGVPDAGTPDAGAPDAGPVDAGAPDAGAPDAGPVDAGAPDAGPVDAGAPDAGSPADAGTPDAGRPDAGTPDAGSTVDAGTPPSPPETVLFTDSFERTSSELGPQWQESLGLWYARSRGISDLTGTNVATELAAACADCRAEVDLITFGVPYAGLFVRAPLGSAGDRYEAVVISSGRVQIREVRAGRATVLGEAASGLSSLSSTFRLVFSARGAGPVQLTASVNGVVRLSAADTTDVLAGAGRAGLVTGSAGVPFDNFRLVAEGSTPVPDAGVPDAGTPDAGTPDAGTPDGGTPDAGAPDAGSPPDAGTPDAGALSSVTVTFTNTQYSYLARDPAGTSYAKRIGASSNALYASTDNARTWTLRGSHASGNGFNVLTAMSDGTLLAQTSRSGVSYLSRSLDGGRTWSDVLNIGSYRALTSHSWTELAGTFYFAEYQTFTGQDAPIRVWASTDRGATWSVRSTHTAHRHAHGIVADPLRGALWLFFGDTSRQSAMKRSTDGGRTWTTLRTGQESIAVDGTVLADGSMLYGQDISYLPSLPGVARLHSDGRYTHLASLPGPSYSIHALSGGGYVVNASREPGGDIYPPGEESTYLFSSPDGVTWTPALKYRRLSSTENARIDVYWALPSGELVLEMHNVVQGDGATGKGYQLLRPVRR